jgi:hypothetical protein
MIAEQHSASSPADQTLKAISPIFIGGSWHVETIPADVARRIDNILERGHSVIIGDAPGADTAVQRYMRSYDYPPVTVFCSGRRCRNNLSHWPTRHVTPSADAQGFQFYAAKDRAMAGSSDFGFML